MAKTATFNNFYFLLQVEIPPSDLGATASLNETLSLLREVLSSHDASVVPLDARQGDYSKVLYQPSPRLSLARAMLCLIHGGTKGYLWWERDRGREGTRGDVTTN